ncbi:MAG TPA: hypothetical protein VFX21_02505 [Acidimicrobiia bacterium]|nr:hypothetical protein [Acidimicrobiia bacterium]
MSADTVTLTILTGIWRTAMNEFRRRAEAIADRVSALIGHWGGYVTLNDTEFRVWHPDKLRLDRAMAHVSGAYWYRPRLDQPHASGAWRIPVDNRIELVRALRDFDPRRHKFVIDATTAQALQMRPQVRITTKLSRIFGHGGQH